MNNLDLILRKWWVPRPVYHKITILLEIVERIRSTLALDINADFDLDDEIN